MNKLDLITSALGLVAFAYSAAAQPSLPATFKAQTFASPKGADMFVRSGGSGPVVVPLRGYAETSDSWGPLAADLAKNFTVVQIPGVGPSSTSYVRSRCGPAARSWEAVVGAASGKRP
jgi:pimeloyl-ACP methyl ester carboxylesterase